MKKLLFIMLLCPLISTAQEPGPKYENDTLYTTSGYKIYQGKTLQFGTGTGKGGKFKYINIKNGVPARSLTNTSIVVKELKNYGISALGNGYIEIIGTIVFKDSSKGYVDIHMAFDRVMENSPGLPSELVVPDEFRYDKKRNITDEINRLYKLYKDGAINKTEYEAQKKKILEQ